MQEEINRSLLESRRLGCPGRAVLEHRDEKGKVLYRYVAGQVLVATDDVPRIADALHEEGAEPVRLIHGMVVFEVPRGEDVPNVVGRLRGLDAGPVVSPNCVLQPALHDIWGSAQPPEPADPLPPLPEGRDLPGAGVKVGVVDTGLDLREWFRGRARRARAGDIDEDRLDEGLDGVLDYEAGHGTHVAGIVLQHAPGADVIVWSARVTVGQIDDAAANEGIVGLVRDHDVDILNLSFGAVEQHQIDHEPIRLALEEARRLKPDLVVVAAAGNRDLDHMHVGEEEGEPAYRTADDPSFPAAFDGVISVGAVDAVGQVPPFSLAGDWVTCSSLGTDIPSTFIDWNGKRALTPQEEDDTIPPIGEVTFEGFARCSGTSFAAPRVTGGIAAAMSPKGQSKRSPSEAVDKVLRGGGQGRVVNPHNFVTGR